MRHRIFIRPRAEEDLREAQLWHERRQAGLGTAFLEEIGKALANLAEKAERFSTYYRDFRRILVLRFPYKIFYLLEKDMVVVFRLLHAKRDHRPVF